MGQNDDFNIDRAFDGILGSRLYALQLEYFDCIMELQSKSEISQLITNNIYKLPIADQIEILKSQLNQCALYERIAKKHGIFPKSED